MTGHAEVTTGTWYEGRMEGLRLEFVRAFRSGTGGLRVAIFDDRIVTYLRDGGTAELPIVDISSAFTFESGASQPAYGVLFEVKAAEHNVAYRFEDDAARAAFLRAVRRRMRRVGTLSDPSLVGGTSG